jgi:translation initiation factor IF-1
MSRDFEVEINVQLTAGIPGTLIKNRIWMSSKDSSEVKSTGCSSKGPGFKP